MYTIEAGALLSLLVSPGALDRIKSNSSNASVGSLTALNIDGTTPFPRQRKLCVPLLWEATWSAAIPAFDACRVLSELTTRHEVLLEPSLLTCGECDVPFSNAQEIRKIGVRQQLRITTKIVGMMGEHNFSRCSVLIYSFTGASATDQQLCLAYSKSVA